MENLSLVIGSILAVGSFAALSVLLYVVLPKSVLETAAEHGRYAGLAASDSVQVTTASGGGVRIDSLQGQSA